MRMLGIVMLLITLVASQVDGQHIHREDERLNCEPYELKMRKSTWWINRYGMTHSSTGWLLKVIHRSNQTFPYIKFSVGDKELGATKVHAYYVEVEVKKAGYFLPFLQEPVATMYTFHRGDSGVIHEIDVKTREYRRTEIGFHKQKYVHVISAGNWFSLNVEKHRDEKFAMMGVTLIRENHNPYLITFADRDELIAEYPEHRDIIMKYAKPSEDNARIDPESGLVVKTEV